MLGNISPKAKRVKLAIDDSVVMVRMVAMPPNGDLTSATCPSCKTCVGGNAVMDIVQHGFEQTLYFTVFQCGCGQHVGCIYAMLNDESEILPDPFYS
jgi:hypothetical protein